MTQPLFLAAYPYQENVLTLPVEDLDRAAEYYAAFGLSEVERTADPPAVIMERDGIRIGFAITGADPEQDGAAILVSDIALARSDFEAGGITCGEGRIDERDGKRFSVFFIVAPDGLCFYIHQELDGAEAPQSQ